MVQLHGAEDEGYIRELRRAVSAPVIQAFSVRSPEDIQDAGKSSADFILLDHGAGGTGQASTGRWLRRWTGRIFWPAGCTRATPRRRPELRPYAVDVSSGIETEGVKDRQKMVEFVRRIRHTF